MDNTKIAVLCSGFGLGFYIPGALLFRQLRDRGNNPALYVFEKYLTPEKKSGITSNRKEYHEDFKVAVTASKMPFDIRKYFDSQAVSALLQEWRKNDIRFFISLSGHWGYILDQYQEMVDFPIHVDSMLIDADLAPSWVGLRRYNPSYYERYNNIRFYNMEKYQINYALLPDDNKRIPLPQRENRFVIHGGGWGMGTYQATIQKLFNAGFFLDIVLYEDDQPLIQDSRVHYYRNDPMWKCWEVDKNGSLFPPFSLEIPEKPNKFQQTDKTHWLFEPICRAKAIICKPGAGTLIDSLSSHTPVVLLDPFGKHERKNYEIWVKLGFGIPFADWEATHFSTAVLEQMSEKIAEYEPSVPRYIDFIEKRI